MWAHNSGVCKRSHFTPKKMQIQTRVEGEIGSSHDVIRSTAVAMLTFCLIIKNFTIKNSENFSRQLPSSH